MARKRATALSEQLRQAIRESEESLCQIAAQCGVTDGALSRFVRRERGLTLKSADALCKYLGLELRQSKRKGR